MTGPISEFLAADHARLDALLARALASPPELDRPAFDAFREALLHHIAMEEKVLFPAARAAAAGEPVPHERRLRVDHGAIAALLVPPPSAEIALELRKLLAPHDEVEEGDAGVYAACEARLAGPRAAEVLAELRRYPRVKVAPYRDGPRVCRTAEEALRVSSMQAERRR
jgi:hypothetical protein